jgi:hypothetical protein
MAWCICRDTAVLPGTRMRQRFEGKHVQITGVTQQSCYGLQFIQCWREMRSWYRCIEHAKCRAQTPRCDTRLVQVLRIVPG